MATGQVRLIQENTASGGISAVERTVLFIGLGATGAQFDQLHVINQQTDLDALLGNAGSALKTNIKAAALNAGPNFSAWVIPLKENGGKYQWDSAIEFALDAPNDIYPEQVALTQWASSAEKITEMQAAAVAAENVFGKYITIHSAVGGINSDKNWADYLSATKALQSQKVADRVALVPQLHGNNLGVVMGRLNNDAFSLGDSPMRVRSGAVVGLGEAPVDSEGQALTMAELQELADARFSVPQTYSNFDGTYWADHPMLDAEGGDFQVYEHRRIIDFLSRRVRVLMIQKVADRSLNSSKSSTAFHQQYFIKPVFDAAKGITINGEPKPGLVKKPRDGDVSIHWQDSKSVELAFVAAPLDSPKSITARIALDLNRLGE